MKVHTRPTFRGHLIAVAASSLAAATLAVVGAAPSAHADDAATGKTLVGWGKTSLLGAALSGNSVITKTPLNLGGAESTVTQASTGDDLTLLLAPAGVYAVGAAGSAGLGQSTGAANPTLIPGTSDVTAVSTGGAGLLLRTNGTVAAWSGTNSAGQAGGTKGTPVYLPTTVASLSDVTAIAEAYSTSFALKSDGTVWAWGEHTALGSAAAVTAGDTATPVKVNLPAGRKAVKLVGGGQHALALLDDGSVAAWGLDDTGQVGDGQQNAPDAEDDRVVPDPVVVLRPADLPQGVTVTDLTAGGNTSYALLSNGDYRAWGAGINGALGLGTGPGTDDNATAPDNATVPTAPATGTPAALGSRPAFVQIVARENTVLARTATGTVYGWGLLRGPLFNTGSNGAAASENVFPYSSGSKTFKTEIPQKIANLSGVGQLSTGFGEAVVAFADAVLQRVPVGDGANGQLGFLQVPVGTVSVPRQLLVCAVGGTSTIKSVKITLPANATSNEIAEGDFQALIPGRDLPYTLSTSDDQFGVLVRFTPSALGVRKAALKITSTDGEVVEYQLDGYGTALPGNVAGAKGDTGATGPAGPAGPAGSSSGVVAFAPTSTVVKVRRGGTAALRFVLVNGTSATLDSSTLTAAAPTALKTGGLRSTTVAAVPSGASDGPVLKLKVGTKAKPGKYAVKVTLHTGTSSTTRTIRVQVRK